MISLLVRSWSADAAWGWLVPGPAARPVEYALAAILGLCLGSFLNVLIYRLPRRESVAWPASHCPHCGKPIAPWDNVPLLSFLLLEARCRACRAPIAWRYPLVEGLSSGAALALVAWLGVSLAALGALYFTLCLLAVAWIDHDHRIVPDTLSGALLAGGLLVRGADPLGLATALLGALLGSGGLYAVAWGYRRVRGVEGLGGGDVKLAAGLGAFLGPPGVLLTVLLSAALGSLVGLWLLATRRGSGRTALPFATFLAPAALTVLAAGPALWRGYLELARVAAGP